MVADPVIRDDLRFCTTSVRLSLRLLCTIMDTNRLLLDVRRLCCSVSFTFGAVIERRAELSIEALTDQASRERKGSQTLDVSPINAVRVHQ